MNLCAIRQLCRVKPKKKLEALSATTKL